MTREAAFLLILALLNYAAIVQSYKGREHNHRDLRKIRAHSKASSPSGADFEVYMTPQDGRKASDKIVSLPGQPNAEFNQYSGYVKVDNRSGTELFYYFAVATNEPARKPLVLWLNGGPGCSSLGGGALSELGPFTVREDGTLQRNQFAWNKSNIIFLESPVGVGFSISNDTNRYVVNSDATTAQDSYTFLVNWLERFPEYKNRDFYIMGESYGGHYVPQLAQLIFQMNKKPNQNRVINLRGIALGNPTLDDLLTQNGQVEFHYMHSVITKSMRDEYFGSCPEGLRSASCESLFEQFTYVKMGINEYNIYAPLCNLSSDSPANTNMDPCILNYVNSYLNNRQVQEALHVNVAAILSSSWKICRDENTDKWAYDYGVKTVLPLVKELMGSGIRFWIYSGDVDPACSTISTELAIEKLGATVKTKWFPWLNAENEVGGFAEEYHNLTFITVRDSGHMVPADQPARAFTVFSSFLEGKRPPIADFASDV